MCKLGISESDYNALITELEVEMFNHLRCSSTTCCAQSFVASGRLWYTGYNSDETYREWNGMS